MRVKGFLVKLKQTWLRHRMTPFIVSNLEADEPRRTELQQYTQQYTQLRSQAQEGRPGSGAADVRSKRGLHDEMQ